MTADPRLQGEKNIQNVTDRDLAAVKQHNPQLYKKLKDAFEQNAKKSDGTIIAELTKIIEKHLKLKEGPLAQLLNKLLGR